MIRRPCPTCDCPSYPAQPFDTALLCWRVCAACRTELRQRLCPTPDRVGNDPLLVPWIAQTWYRAPSVNS